MDRAVPPDNRRSPARSIGGEEEGSPPPDDLPACLSCRRRKSRCSRERPSCSQCARIGAECHYVVRQKPGIKAGAVDSLGRRLEVLENLLLDGAGNTKAKLAALLEWSDDRPVGSGHSPWRRPLLTERDRTPTCDDSFGCAEQDPCPNEGGSESEGHRRKRQRVDDESYRYWNGDDDVSWIPPLPPRLLLEAVVEAHFQTVHHWIPILHETRFRAKLKDLAQKQKLTILLHALLSSAIKYVDFVKFGMSVQDVTKQIRISRRAVMMHALESLSVENTQALIVIAFDHMGSGNVTKAWPIIGSLTRIVDYLQLTIEPNEESLKQPLLQSLTILAKPQDWTESEERRRLFWNVFLLDRICSVTSGWHTSLTSDVVRRRLPCGGAMWARSEPVSTPYFGIWDKSAAKIGHSISNAPTIYQSLNTIEHPSPSSNGDVDASKLGAFAYCIEATENLSQVTSFFLRQSVDFDDREELKDWLTRFKELDLRLVHWKMFLPRQWQDSNVSRDVQVIKMDPNLTLAHVSHNTSMILLHQHIAYPPTRWKDVVKLPSSCSAETCHLAAVETASIVQKYLRYMGGIVNSQFAFCAFVAARVLLIHWRSHQSPDPAPEFFDLLQSLDTMSDKWRGYLQIERAYGLEKDNIVGLAGSYATQLREWHSHCLDDPIFMTTNIADILCQASFYGLRVAHASSALLTGSRDMGQRPRNTSSYSHQVDRRSSFGFEAYQSAGVPSPARGPDLQTGSLSHRSPNLARHSTAYEAHGMTRAPGDNSPRSQQGTMPSPTVAASANLADSSDTSHTMLNGMNLARNFSHGQSGMVEDDELTVMSHMLLGNQFLEMDRVITLQGTDFFHFETARRAGFSG